jgi:hypothetical protein
VRAPPQRSARRPPTRDILPQKYLAFIARDWLSPFGFCDMEWRASLIRRSKAVHPPPGMLDNSELAANSRKKEYSVSLPLCLAGFWLIKGGVGGGGGGRRGGTEMH